MDCEKVSERLQVGHLYIEPLSSSVHTTNIMLNHRIGYYFQEFGHKAAFYHGSMEPEQRAFIQTQWSKDEINIICATVAFGMGTGFC